MDPYGPKGAVLLPTSVIMGIASDNADARLPAITVAQHPDDLQIGISPFPNDKRDKILDPFRSYDRDWDPRKPPPYDCLEDIAFEFGRAWSAIEFDILSKPARIPIHVSLGNRTPQSGCRPNGRNEHQEAFYEDQRGELIDCEYDIEAWKGWKGFVTSRGRLCRSMSGGILTIIKTEPTDDPETDQPLSIYVSELSALAILLLGQSFEADRLYWATVPCLALIISLTPTHARVLEAQQVCSDGPRVMIALRKNARHTSLAPGDDL